MPAIRILLLVLHVMAVAFGVVYYVLSVTVYDTPDANIGTGLGLLWLMTYGLPWSWPLFRQDHLSTDASTATIIALAALNLILHAAIPAVYHRVRRARAAAVARRPS